MDIFRHRCCSPPPSKPVNQFILDQEEKAHLEKLLACTWESLYPYLIDRGFMKQKYKFNLPMERNHEEVVFRKVCVDIKQN